MGDDDGRGTTPGPNLRRLRLRFGGTCVLCGRRLEKGSEALYDSAARNVRCVECARGSEFEIESGSAGSSAHREYERRRTARAVRVKGRLGDLLGGIALAVTGDPQSTRAWERGSVGEQKLARALAEVHDLTLLNDRRVSRTRGNIDHIAIAPAGVFVIDAKHYQGLIQVRARGGLFTRDDRLHVGGRDCSRLADNLTWQVSAVRAALESAGTDLSVVSVTPVLCFVDGEWPLLFPPDSFRGVRLEGPKSIKGLLTGSNALSREQIERVSRVLASAFPAK